MLGLIDTLTSFRSVSVEDVPVIFRINRDRFGFSSEFFDGGLGGFSADYFGKTIPDLLMAFKFPEGNVKERDEDGRVLSFYDFIETGENCGYLSLDADYALIVLRVLIRFGPVSNFEIGYGSFDPKIKGVKYYADRGAERFEACDIAELFKKVEGCLSFSDYI